MDKKQLRKQLLATRGGLSEEVRREKSDRIVQKILTHPTYHRSQFIFSFVPFDSEVDIRPLLERALADGKRVAIPWADIKKKEMILYLFEGWERLVEGAYGILEPDPASATPVDPEQLDLILMPGVGFDRYGGRIGYGGGFYDRFLEKLKDRPPLVAPCFAEQIIDRAPMEEHDFRVDWLITDEEVHFCLK